MSAAPPSPLIVVSLERLGESLLRVRLGRASLAAFNPGQYLVFGHHAFAIASSPDPGAAIELFVRLPDPGAAPHPLEAYHPGDEIRAWRLGGRGLTPHAGVPLIRFFATGTALAAFRSYLLSEAFRRSTVRVEVWAGLRAEEDLVILKELLSMPRVSVEYTLSRPTTPDWAGRVGRLDALVDRLPPEFFRQHSHYSVCGHGEFVRDMHALLNSHGVEPSLILAPN